MKFTGLPWILGFLLFSPWLCADDSSVEYKIKAGYLYNFTKFISWPADNAETFNLCIIGNDPFGELIDPIEQRAVLGRPIKLFRYDGLGRLDKESHCHILFVDSSIKDRLSGRNFDGMLVVGDSEEFIAQGGMIGFINKEGKIKLQINLKKIKLNTLKISAKLLEVAEVVKGGNDD
jgi:hypothetical protein